MLAALTGAGLSATRLHAQRAAAGEVSLRALARLLRRPADDPSLKKFVRMQSRVNECSPQQLKELERFILSVVNPFCELFGYDGGIRDRVVARAYEHIFAMAHLKESEA